jgi:hypothetical protein
MTEAAADDANIRMIADRIKHAEHVVTQELARRRRFYPRPVRVGTSELLGYERDLAAEPLTESEALMLLMSSVNSAADSVLHLIYQPANGLDVVRTRALIEVVVLGGKYEFAKQADLQAAFRMQRWSTVANAITTWLIARGVNPEEATTLADRIRTGKPEAA